MRVGQNPNRGKAAFGFKKTIATCVTHLPNEEGYHAHRFDVIQLCLTTMRKHAGMDVSIAVWDNGSCAKLRDWLTDEYKPDILIMSHNVGKTAARSSLFNMFRPDTIIGYSDDDMYFYPDWLIGQTSLLGHFPNVAAVTGYPVRTAFRWGVTKTQQWAELNGAIRRGKFIPQEWEDDFCRSIGRDIEFHRNYTAKDEDTIVRYNGMEAYCTAHHCQFIGYAKTLQRAARYDGEAMGDEKIIDNTLDSLGLRLATTERLTRHIGNVIDESIRSLPC